MPDGWVDLNVCAACFDDSFLKECVERSAKSTECGFCGRTSDSPIAAPAEEMLEVVRDGLMQYYSRASDVLIRDSEEDRWDGPTLDTWELLEGAGVYGNLQLLEASVEHLGGADDWVRENFLNPTEGESVALDWDQFVAQVESSRRFIFAKPPVRSGPRKLFGLASPSETLRRVGDLVDEYDLVRELKPTEQLFRVRVHRKGTEARTAQDLGSPPARDARANRMSAPGISTFYGALDDLTAVAETVEQADAAERLVSLGTFRLTLPVLIVDLTRVPPVPSIYESSGTRHKSAREVREDLVFLNDWIGSLRLPVHRDGTEHIDYVATQILAEYFRFEHYRPEIMPISGIAFESSRTTDGTVVALFIDQDDCIDRSDPPDADQPEADQPQLVLTSHQQLNVQFEVRIERESKVAT